MNNESMKPRKKNSSFTRNCSVVACLITIGVAMQLGSAGCKNIFIDEDPAARPQETFDFLWNDLQDRYAYLDYKGVHWNEVYDTLAPKINEGMSNTELFNVLASMLNTLRDGHVNLYAWFNRSNYFPVFLGSPQNFDGRLVLENYLLRVPSRYYLTGGLQHTVLDTLGLRVGYVRYATFQTVVKDYEISFIVNRFLSDSCDGVIFDVRNNGGGSVSNVFTLVNHFADEKRLAYYSEIKTAPGDNFGDREEVYTQPAASNVFTGRVAVLTNRTSYSATSLFTLAMKSLPHVKLIGDSTGGGLGAPTFAELPNGWSYRFSVTRTLSPNGDNWEDGIPADILVDLDPEIAVKGYDTMIERAMEYIKNGD
jgi:hypothetical protein